MKDAVANGLIIVLLLGVVAAVGGRIAYESRPAVTPESCDEASMHGEADEPGPTPADSPPTHWYRWAQMRDAQRVTGKPAYVLASDPPNCPPCVVLERDVLPTEDVQRILERFVCVKLQPHEFGAWKITLTPSAVFVRPNGNVVRRQACPVTQAKYLTHLIDGYNAAKPPSNKELTDEAKSTAAVPADRDRRRG